MSIEERLDEVLTLSVASFELCAKVVTALLDRRINSSNAPWPESLLTVS